MFAVEHSGIFKNYSSIHNHFQASPLAIFQGKISLNFGSIFFFCVQFHALFRVCTEARNQNMDRQHTNYSVFPMNRALGGFGSGDGSRLFFRISNFVQSKNFRCSLFNIVIRLEFLACSLARTVWMSANSIIQLNRVPFFTKPKIPSYRKSIRISCSGCCALLYNCTTLLAFPTFKQRHNFKFMQWNYSNKSIVQLHINIDCLDIHFFFSSIFGLNQTDKDQVRNNSKFQAKWSECKSLISIFKEAWV